MSEDIYNKTGFIYQITNLTNNKKYIGQTSRTISKRWSEHKKSAKTNIKTPLYDSIRHYGIDNFIIETIIEAPINDLDMLETNYIKTLNTLYPNGYNLETGGHLNKKLNDITKAKISQNHADFSGKNHPLYGLKGINNPSFGKHHFSEQSKKIISNKIKEWRKHNNHQCCKIKCLELNKFFKSCHEADNFLNVSKGTVSKSIRKNRKCKNYTFIRVD